MIRQARATRRLSVDWRVLKDVVRHAARNDVLLEIARHANVIEQHFFALDVVDIVVKHARPLRQTTHKAVSKQRKLRDEIDKHIPATRLAQRQC